MDTIFKNDWMEIIRVGNSYSIRYNSGDHINSIREIQVTEEEAIRAQRSDADADEIIIDYQNKEMFGEDYMGKYNSRKPKA